MKLANNFGLKWKDAINVIIITLIANMLMIIMAAADATFPTLEDFRIGLISSVKFAIIPYLLKNFFSDDIKQAQNTLSKAKLDGKEAASPIPPVSLDEKIDISKFPPTHEVPKGEDK